MQGQRSSLFSEGALMLADVNFDHPLHFSPAHRWRSKADRLGAKRHIEELRSPLSDEIIHMDQDHFKALKDRVLQYHHQDVMVAALKRIGQGAYVPLASLPGGASLTPYNGGSHYIFDVDNWYPRYPHYELLELLHLTADIAELAALGNYDIDAPASLYGDVAGLVAQARVYYGLPPKDQAHVMAMATALDKRFDKKRYIPILELFTQNHSLATFCDQVLTGSIENQLIALYPIFQGQSLKPAQRLTLVTLFGETKLVAPAKTASVSPVEIAEDLQPTRLWKDAVQGSLALGHNRAYPALMALAERLEKKGYPRAAYYILHAVLRIPTDEDIHHTRTSLPLAWQARLAAKSGHRGVAMRLFRRAIAAALRWHRDQAHPLIDVAKAMAEAAFYFPKIRDIAPLNDALSFVTTVLIVDVEFEQLIHHAMDIQDWKRAAHLLHEHKFTSAGASGAVSSKRYLSALLAVRMSQAGLYADSRAAAEHATEELSLLLPEVERLRLSGHLDQALALATLIENGRKDRLKRQEKMGLVTTDQEPNPDLSFQFLAIRMTQALRHTPSGSADLPALETEIASLLGSKALSPEQALEQTMQLSILLFENGPPEALSVEERMFDRVDEAVEALTPPDDALRLRIAQSYAGARLAKRARRLLERLPPSRQTPLIRLERIKYKAMSKTETLWEDFISLQAEMKNASLKDVVLLALVEIDAGYPSVAHALLREVLADPQRTTLSALSAVLDALHRLGYLVTIENSLEASRQTLTVAALPDFVTVGRFVAKTRIQQGDYSKALTAIRWLTHWNQGFDLLIDLAMAVAEQYHLPLPDGPASAFQAWTFTKDVAAIAPILEEARRQAAKRVSVQAAADITGIRATPQRLRVIRLPLRMILDILSSPWKVWRRVTAQALAFIDPLEQKLPSAAAIARSA